MIQRPPPAKKGKGKKPKEPKAKICYFCLWNDPVTEIRRNDREIFLACRYCATVMGPLVNSKGGAWGWNLAALRPIHPEAVQYHSKQLLRCHHCSFRTFHEESLRHHMLYSHKPNHPSPPNLQSEESKQEWLDRWKKYEKGHRW